METEAHIKGVVGRGTSALLLPLKLSYFWDYSVYSGSGLFGNRGLYTQNVSRVYKLLEESLFFVFEEKVIYISMQSKMIWSSKNVH